MQPAEEINSVEEESEAEDEMSGPQSLIPDEISELFRLFEMDIRCSGNSAYYRVITSSHVEKILSLGKPGLGLVTIYLFETLDNNETNADPIIIEAWCIVISFFAENLEASDAPQGSDTISDWFMWAANYVGIAFEEEPEDDEFSEDEDTE
ncbi:MAG: hypothetical protein P1P90_06680 [Patescibacteria group bacterium]|nr:hypothetical protein [Patescibacteria group bacterium]